MNNVTDLYIEGMGSVLVYFIIKREDIKITLNKTKNMWKVELKDSELIYWINPDKVLFIETTN